METKAPYPSPFVRSLTIAGVALALGLLFDRFFFGHIPAVGLAFPLYILAAVAGFFLLARIYRRQPGRDIIWLLVPLAFFAAMVFVRTSLLLTFLNILACLLLLFLMAEIAFGGRLRKFAIEDYLKIPFLPFRFLMPMLRTLAGLFSARGTTKSSRTWSQVGNGVLMAIPVLVVFILLFSSADLVFKKYLLNLVDPDISVETVARTILVFLVTLACMGAYAYAFRERKPGDEAPRADGPGGIGSIESSILLGSVNALFLIFILLQLTYLFGGENNIYAQGFTYAAYARRGFFELMAVAAISLLLLMSVERHVRKGNKGHTPLFRSLSAILVVEVILIMASSFARLSLYEEAYGFTTLRLYSHAFIILLAAIFCLLTYKIFRDRSDSGFALRSFLAVVLFLAGMNLLNPDAFIARRNVERFRAGAELDVHHLTRLSDDAVPEMLLALDAGAGDQYGLLARELYWRAEDADRGYDSDWRSLNIARMRAEDLLDSRIEDLRPYRDHEPPEDAR